jgi:hypothetical protein
MENQRRLGRPYKLKRIIALSELPTVFLHQLTLSTEQKTHCGSPDRPSFFQPQPYCVERRVHIWVNSPSIHYCRGFACFYPQFILNYHRLDMFV